jgi:hypothetical protein
VTVLVGVRCNDGVVIGADGIATSSMGQHALIHLESGPKIEIFDNIIVATSGPIGYKQRLRHHVEAAIKGGVFKNTAREATINIPHRFLPDLRESNAPSWGADGYRFGAFMAAVVKDGPFLAEFGSTDFQPELKVGKLFFGSMGSGQMYADPFLAFVCRVLWKNEMPSIDRGKFGVYWVLEHTLKVAPGKVGKPTQLATLREINGKWVAKEEDTQESSEYVKALEEHIGYFEQPPIEEATPVPVPKPPESDKSAQ